MGRVSCMPSTASWFAPPCSHCGAPCLHLFDRVALKLAKGASSLKEVSNLSQESQPLAGVQCAATLRLLVVAVSPHA
jgi:hypothetical protein